MLQNTLKKYIEIYRESNLKIAAKYLEEIYRYIDMHKAKHFCNSTLKMVSFALVQSNYIIAVFRWSGNLGEIWGSRSWAYVVSGNVVAVRIDLIQAIQYVKPKSKTYKREI